MILPAANMVDLRDIPTELARRIEFVPVEHMDDVLDAVLLRPLGPRSRRSTQKRSACTMGRAGRWMSSEPSCRTSPQSKPN